MAGGSHPPRRNHGCNHANPNRGAWLPAEAARAGVVVAMIPVAAVASNAILDPAISPSRELVPTPVLARLDPLLQLREHAAPPGRRECCARSSCPLELVNGGRGAAAGPLTGRVVG